MNPETQEAVLRVFRPQDSPRPQTAPKPTTGQERVQRASEEGEADGKAWARRKARRGTLYCLSYFMTYMEAFNRGAQEIVTEVNIAEGFNMKRELESQQDELSAKEPF
ncbi:MAG: hypothetical protein K2R98_31565 [Gemmataceae bacterium]|nr:hypothetical protein [Gemmataceae bacterium]